MAYNSYQRVTRGDIAETLIEIAHLENGWCVDAPDSAPLCKEVLTRLAIACALLMNDGFTPHWIDAKADGQSVELGFNDSLQGLSWEIFADPFDDWVRGDGKNGYEQERINHELSDVPQVLELLKKHLGV